MKTWPGVDVTDVDSRQLQARDNCGHFRSLSSKIGTNFLRQCHEILWGGECSRGQLTPTCARFSEDETYEELLDQLDRMSASTSISISGVTNRIPSIISVRISSL